MSRPQLAALPNELLLMLANNLQPRDLNALLRTSRHMHALFNNELYKATIRERGNSVLFWACIEGIDKVVTRCLALGASAEAACYCGPMGASVPFSTYVQPIAQLTDPPIFSAIIKGHEKVVEVLLDHGVNFETPSHNTGLTPLDVAAKDGKTKILRLLISKGANVNQSAPRTDSPLHTAVRANRDHLETIRILLDANANPNATNADQATALHIAPNKETVETLIDWGADVNVVDRYDRTPLSVAIKEKRDATWAELLIKAGARVNEPNSRGETPLFYVGQGGGAQSVRERRSLDVEIAHVLIDHGAELTLTDLQGSTALHQACYEGDEETIKLFLSHGSDACCKNRKGLTPLHIAAEEGHPHIVRLLLSKGAKVNAPNYYRSTPLHRMASIPKRKLRAPGNQDRFIEVMQILLDKNADVNRQDRIGQTPLMKASYHGYWPFVNVMMERRELDLTIKDRRNKTAAELAKEGGEESRNLIEATDAAVTKKFEAAKPVTTEQAVRDGIREAVQKSIDRGIAHSFVDWGGDSGHLW